MCLEEIIIYSLLILPPFIMAVPVYIRTRSWKDYLKKVAVYTAGIHIPLIVFFLSIFMSPNSKCQSKTGWLECFHYGKQALSLLVIWASAAFYAVEVVSVNDRNKYWIRTGYYVGAISSTLCFITGMVIISPYIYQLVRHIRPGSLLFLGFMLVPLYVSVWYTLRTFQFSKAQSGSLLYHLSGWLISLPFAAVSFVMARREYTSLPETSGCFVVTAAAKGHHWLVGPFYEAETGGRTSIVNRQLETLRCFERIWSGTSPVSHRLFRNIYNMVGPAVAVRIRSPWMADAVYVAVKPVELLARCVVSKTRL